MQVAIENSAFIDTPIASSTSNSGKVYVHGKLFSQYKGLAKYSDWGKHLAAIPGTETYEVTCEAKLTYTGKALAPKITVTSCDGKTLKKGTGFKVAYKNAKGATVKASSLKNAGRYKAVITYKGKTTTKAFTVARASNPMKVKALAKTVKLNGAKKLAKAKKVGKPFKFAKKASGKVTYSKAKGSSGKLSVNKKTGEVTVAKGAKAGTYTVKIKITAKGNANYKSASKTIGAKVHVK